MLNVIAITLAIIVVRKSYNYKKRGSIIISKIGWFVIGLTLISILGTWELGSLEKKESELKLDAQFKKNEKLLELHKDSITIRVTRDILRGVGNTVSKSTSQIIDLTTAKLLTSTKQTIDTIYSYKSNTLAKIDSIYSASMFSQTDISNLIIQIYFNVDSNKLPGTGVVFFFTELVQLLPDDSKVPSSQLKFMTSLFLPAFHQKDISNKSFTYGDPDYRSVFDNLNIEETTKVSLNFVISKNPLLRLHLLLNSSSTNQNMQLYAESQHKKIIIPLGRKWATYKSSNYNHSQWNVVNNSPKPQEITYSQSIQTNTKTNTQYMLNTPNTKTIQNKPNLFVVIVKEDLNALYDDSNKFTGHSVLNKDFFVSYIRSSCENGENAYRVNKYFTDLGFKSLSFEIINSALPQYVIKDELFYSPRMIQGGNNHKDEHFISFAHHNDKDEHILDLIGK